MFIEEINVAEEHGELYTGWMIEGYLAGSKFESQALNVDLINLSNGESARIKYMNKMV